MEDRTGFVSLPAIGAMSWENRGMALGRARIGQGFQDPRDILGDRLREGSLYRLLAGHGQVMFGDGYFAELYTGSVMGQPTVPARVVATVMVLQAFEGLSDREARPAGGRPALAGRGGGSRTPRLPPARAGR